MQVSLIDYAVIWLTYIISKTNVFFFFFFVQNLSSLNKVVIIETLVTLKPLIKTWVLNRIKKLWKIIVLYRENMQFHYIFPHSSSALTQTKCSDYGNGMYRKIQIFFPEISKTTSFVLCLWFSVTALIQKVCNFLVFVF